MTKLPDWEHRLSALVSQALTRSFAWGTHDCCIWAAACVEAQTGADHAAEFRGTYGSPSEGAPLLRRMRGLRGVVSTFLPQGIPPLMARHGDIGLVRGEQRPLLGLCNADHWLVVGTHGLVIKPFDTAKLVWRVGNA